MQPQGLLHCSSSRHVLCLHSGHSNSRLQPAAPTDSATMQQINIASGGPAGVHITSKVSITKPNHCLTIVNSAKDDTIVSCTSNIPQHALCNLPMCNSRPRHIPSKSSHRLSQVWPCANRQIQQTAHQLTITMHTRI